MGPRRASGGRRKRPAFGGRIDGWPLRRRRIAAALSSLLIALATVIVVAVVEANYAHAREAVLTQERHRSVIVDVEPSRGSDTYFIEADGQKQIIDHTFIRSGSSVGEPVEYVVDPVDESHLIAVGTPADWKDVPWYRSASFPVAVALALMFIAMTCGRFIPEDLQAAAEKLVPRPKKFTGRRALPRRDGGTGCHVRGR